MNKTVIYIFLLAWILTTPTQILSAAEKPLKLGIFPFNSPKKIIKLFLPVARRLEDSIGSPVQISSAPNADEFNKRAIAGEYDIIWPCNTCYIKIHDQADYQAIVKGYPDFQGGVIVRKDSGTENLSQLQGKKIAAVGKGSYAGYQFFQLEMKKMGYTTPADYSVSFLGKLDSIIFSVAGRQYDAGIIRLDALNSRRFENIRKQLNVIHTSSIIPQFSFAVKPGTSQELVDKIINTLTSLDTTTPDGKSTLNGLKIKGFIPCSDKDYDNFREASSGLHW